MNKTKKYDREEVIIIIIISGIVLGILISLLFFALFSSGATLMKYSVADEICTELVGEPSTYKKYTNSNVFECELINQTTPKSPSKIILPKQVKR